MNIAPIFVNEVFESVQGEGILSGLWTLFIRLDGCSVKCVFCDTKYSWGKNKKRKHNAYKFTKSITDKYIGKKSIQICITGGEPLEQVDTVLWMTEKLARNGFTNMSLETSGVPLPNTKVVNDLILAGMYFSLSPKLPSAFRKKFDYDSFENCVIFWNDIVELSFGLQFKFVVSNKDDLTVLKKLLSRVTIKHHMFIQVEYSKSKTKFVDECIQFVKDRPFIRFGYQLHKQLGVA